MLRVLAIAGLIGVLAVPNESSVFVEDTEAIEAAAMDYLEGFYTGDASRLRRSVRPEVTKYGFARRSASEAYRGLAMPFDDMLGFAEEVKASGESPPPGAPKEVIILDQMDQIAVVKVNAYWGSDYLQMAKYDGEWMILHVIWQTTE